MGVGKDRIEIKVIVTLSGIVVAIIGMIIGAALQFGKLHEKASTLEKTVQSLQTERNKSEERISSLGTKISLLEMSVQSMPEKIDRLIEQVSSLRAIVYRLESRTNKLRTGTEEPPIIVEEPSTPPVGAIVIKLPLDAGWRPEGSIANNGGGYRDGKLELKANLTYADDYAELFLDLRAVRPQGIKQNQDGSYNLAGMQLIAFVRSDRDFKGEPTHPNGVQFLLKNKNWKSLLGPWLNVTPAMEGEAGMQVFYKIPDVEISRNVAGISLKFTVNSESRAVYKGSFFVKSITIKK